MAYPYVRGVQLNKQHCVWMGDIEPFMNEDFIKNQFQEVGLNVLNVRIFHSNKYQDSNMTYAFVELDDEKTAIKTVQKYNDKPMPGDPRRKFRLNYTCQSQIKQANDDNGLFVGELTPDVDDLTLYNTFQKKYPTTKWARVIKDQGGMSKGFGFVKFTLEEDFNKALYEMQGFTGLGGNAIRVSPATPKEKRQQQQWGSNPNNPMVMHHQSQMQYFNQATSGAQSQSDYYNYYYGHTGAYNYPSQGYYDQQSHVAPGSSRDDRSMMSESNRATGDLEDHGDALYDNLRNHFMSSDLQSEIEASRYSEFPLLASSK